jgi:WD40 repeat protein
MRVLKLQHSGAVRCVAYHPSSAMLASGGDDNKVKAHNLELDREVAVLVAHTDWVRGLAFTDDGERLASAGWDGAVFVSRTNFRPKPHCRGDGHAGGAWSVAFSPDGYLLAVGAGDGTVHFYHGQGDEPLHRKGEGHKQPVSGLAFTPDGRLLASGSHDGTVRLWDANWGRERKCLRGHGDWVRSVAVSPDGRRLASCSDDGVLIVWSLPGGEEVARVQAHAGPVGQVCFAPPGGGRSLLSVGWDGTARLCGSDDGRPLAAYEWGEGKLLCAATSPDGMTAAAGTGRGAVIVWDLE